MDPCDHVCFQYNIVTLLNSYKGREALKDALEKAGFELPQVEVLAELTWDVKNIKSDISDKKFDLQEVLRLTQLFTKSDISLLQAQVAYLNQQVIRLDDHVTKIIKGSEKNFMSDLLSALQELLPNLQPLPPLPQKVPEPSAEPSTDAIDVEEPMTPLTDVSDVTDITDPTSPAPDVSGGLPTKAKLDLM